MAARAAGADVMIARIDLAASQCYQQAGHGDKALQAAEESLRIAKAHSAVPLLAGAHNSLAGLHLWLGTYDNHAEACNRPCGSAPSSACVYSLESHDVRLR